MRYFYEKIGKYLSDQTINLQTLWICRKNIHKFLSSFRFFCGCLCFS